MTNNQIALIKEALLEEDLAEMAVIDAIPDEDFVFSEKYKIEMQKLLNKHKKCMYNANRFIPKRLVGVLVAILITLTLMMSISAIREPIIKFIVNTYEGFVSIFVDENDEIKSTETVEEIYSPSYMLDGYVKKDFKQFKTVISTVWSKDNDILELRQNVMVEDFQHFTDKEKTEYSTINTISNTIYYINKNENYSFIWTNDIYLFTLICSNSIELSEIEKIIESMEVVED